MAKILYQWKAREKTGKVITGEYEAKSIEDVKLHLIQRLKLDPIKVKKKPKDLLPPKVTHENIILFARQFSTMIDAGLPLVQCLDILHVQEENSTFKTMLKRIKESVEGGATLTDALAQYPKHFDELFVNMVNAGEVGGVLDVILKRLSGYMEKAAKLKSKVKGAMMYPGIVMGISLLVIGVILVFVIPTFQEMFAGMGKALPLPTLIVVNLSNFTQRNLHFIILAFIGTIIGFKRFYATKKGRELIDDLLLMVPFLGTLIRKVAVAKFSRTMSTMLASGVSILDTLDIVSKTSGNKTVEKAISNARIGISGGGTMSDSLSESDVFPPMVVQMIAVGETTGQIDEMLTKLADFYDDEVDQAVSNIMSLIEPIMIVFLGLTIGSLVIAMYLPIFQMAGALGE